MASSARIDELKKKFDENPRRYFAPLANEFRKGGDLDQAILICEEFLPQQPGHMSGHIVYGQTLFESDRLEDARTVFETALSLDPENLIALRHLGDIAARLGDSAAARRWYERVLEADPRNDEIQALISGLDDNASSAGFASAGAPSESPDEPSWQQAPSSEYDGEQSAAPLRDEPDLIDIDLTLPHGVPIVAQHAPPSDHRYGAPADERREEPPFDALSLGGIVPMPDSGQSMPEVEERAQGFEATEFAAPDARIEQTAGLQSAFEDETGIYGAAVTPLEGLDTPEHLDTGGGGSTFDELPPLDEDEGLVLPPHGDPVVASANTPTGSDDRSDLISLDSEFEMPSAASAAPDTDDRAVDDAPSAPMLETMEFDMPAGSEPSASEPSPAISEISSMPFELPPEVIAAEAELIDSGMSMEPPARESADLDAELDAESVGSELTFLDTEEPAAAEADLVAAEEERAPEAEVVSEPAAAAHRPFVTETMAELYLSQGFHEQALSVYQQLSDANPGETRLADKVASLRAAALTPASEHAGPTVRDFFARLASRRPGERAVASAPPAEDDFASDDPHQYESAESEAESPSATLPVAAEIGAPPNGRGAPAAASGGTIDALFGNRPIGTSEDSAASALAQAFGASSSASAPPITGNPARQASGELSLDSVFRDGSSRGPRTSQGFSFDQFFSQNTEGDETSGGPIAHEVSTPGEPAEKSADDIEQFNSWLQGLKNR
ncbi:MAG: tetratricopeptide repeat protein [Gemmatimonadaceae bacterium]